MQRSSIELINALLNDVPLDRLIADLDLGDLMDRTVLVVASITHIEE